jgi:hypothetical protein
MRKLALIAGTVRTAAAQPRVSRLATNGCGPTVAVGVDEIVARQRSKRLIWIEPEFEGGGGGRLHGRWCGRGKPVQDLGCPCAGSSNLMPNRVLSAVVVVLAAVAFLAGPGDAATPNPIVGTWARVNSCTALVRALKGAGLADHLIDTLVGGGYFSAASQVRPATPCLGAHNKKHSHFFTSTHAFGSYDERRKQVDDGDYKLVAPGTLSFPSHAKDFGYKIAVRYTLTSGKLAFRVVVPKPCTGKCRDATAWALSAFYAGPSFHRTQ